ncbi:immunoglobulin-like domain-containing protein [Hyalangium minutum]|uniref:HYR domain-containing protein n=1 Tax=Hyalangium minutum TaxID=394096 RepID=A0A085WV62_9BACT|nr:immunoglobulin-like domain-containing protein [Hyalangium minutum]KFE71575.1 hypothetical protein DB31_3705 [Hyalangium minutum]
MKLKSLVLLLLGVWAVSACGEETRALETELSPEAVATTSQAARSTDKVLILASSVNGGMDSREAQAVRTYSPSTEIHVKTPDEWRAMTAQQFMEYRALIIGDAACQSGTAALDAAVESRSRWGAIVDSNVVIISSDPSSNNTDFLVDNAINSVVVDSIQYRTGMYIALGCAYQNAPANTVVTLLEPFGTFKVQGVPGCARSAHMFQMSPVTLSNGVYDDALIGLGECAARSVFTQYPDHTFSHAAIATRTSGPPLPGEKEYLDYQIDWGTPTAFHGAPYVLVRGAMAWSAGCGDQDNTPDGEQCDAGDGTNGQPAGPGQSPDTTCSFACRLNWCGDGAVDVAQGEECDNGTANGRTGDVSGDIGACTSFCKRPNIAPPNRPPVALCRNVTVSVSNTCGAPANINNGSSDPDGDPITCTQNPAGPYPVGPTTVTLTCSDSRGFGSCSGTVMVADSGAPTVTIDGPASEALECTRGATYAELGATARDLCEGALPVSLSGSVNMGSPATYTLTYTARDSVGNQGSASRTVVVSDTLPPSLSLVGAPTMAQECGVAFTDPSATATDQCAGTLPVTVSGTVNDRVRGPYTLTYSANDGHGHTVSKDRMVSVRDTRAPVVTITGPLGVNVECGGPYTELGATANDLCAGPLAALPTSAPEPAVVGAYPIIYQAVDPDGNVGTSVDSRTVNVRDTLKPVLTLTGANPQPLECGTAWSNPGATAQDQCEGPLTNRITVSGSVDHQAPRQYTVTYSVSDRYGNTETKDRAVSVRDTLPPAITVVGPLQDSAECGSTYVDGVVQAEDVCAGTLPVTRTVAGDTRRPGTMTIEYSATDPSGNQAVSADRRTVSVVDTQAPVLSLRGTARQRLECGTAFTDPGAVATDVCFGDLSGSVTLAGSVEHGAVGDYTLRYDVTDGAGNRAAPAVRTVEVRDTLPPVLTVLPPFNARVQCDHQQFQDPGATASDVCALDLTGSIQRQGLVDTGLPGTYSLSYRVVDPSGNEATANAARSVSVVDDLPPTLELVGAATENVECGAAYTEQGVRATDLCFGDLSDRIVRVGQVDSAVPSDYSIVYSVTDPSNNTASTQRMVKVRDTLKPVLTLTGANPQPLECGTAWVSPGATAHDQCAGPLTAQISVTGTVDHQVPDQYTVTYSVSDGRGNTEMQERAVSVRDTLPPAITVVGPLQDSAECGSTYVDGAVRAEDVCAGTLPVTRTINGDTLRPGTMTIAYSATDPSGNQAVAADRRTVSVVDTQAPVLSLRGTATQRLECGTAFTEPGAVAMDVCFGDISSSITQTGSVDPGAVGDYTVRYEVTDGAGNRATAASRMVQVRDTLPPTLTVLPPFNTRVQCDHQAFQDPGATASDVCALDLTGSIQRQGLVDTGLPGTYSLSYRVVDPSGNEATASTARSVSVVDDLPPTLELVGAATENVECGAAYVEAGVKATDLCFGDLSDRVTRVGEVNPAKPGDYPIVYSVTDPSNNTATTRRDVAVKDTTPPTIVCPDPIVVEVQPGMQADLTPAAARATDVCSQAQVSIPVQKRFPVGDTQLTYTATDEAGNTASCTTTVTVRELKVPDPVPEPPKPGPFDRALLGGGSGCSSTSGGPSSLAMMGLGVLAALLARRARRQ